jgi:hypothetical protein
VPVAIYAEEVFGTKLVFMCSKCGNMKFMVINVNLGVEVYVGIEVTILQNYCCL